MKNNLQRIIVASLVTGVVSFVPVVSIFDDVQSISSIAHAKVETYIGQGTYIISKKESPEFGENAAKQYAERNALEQAGMFLESYSSSINGMLNKDEINAFTAGILKIVDSKVAPTLLTGEAEGYIKYTATVTANIDTDTLNNEIKAWLSRNGKERSNLAEQNKELLQTIDDLKKRNAELEKSLKVAKNKQDKQKVQTKSSGLDKEILYAQKLGQGYKYAYDGNYTEANKKYAEALKLKEFEITVTGSYFIGDDETLRQAEEKALNDAKRLAKEEVDYFLMNYLDARYVNVTSDEISQIVPQIIDSRCEYDEIHFRKMKAIIKVKINEEDVNKLMRNMK